MTDVLRRSIKTAAWIHDVISSQQQEIFLRDKETGVETKVAFVP